MDKALSDELQDALPGMLHQWDPSLSLADYQCVFCHRRPNTNDGDINHDADCLGIRLRDALNRKTYIVAYNVGAEFDIHTCKVEASTPHAALVAVLQESCPALAETTSYEQAREAIIEQDNIAFSVTDIS